MSRRESVEIKSRSEILLMREAGLVVARTLEKLRNAAQPGVTTKELDELAESSIRGEGAIPSFLDYGGHLGQPGFRGSICASVNDEVVHGIPGPRALKDGDLLSIDCGAILEGWHGDSAITVAVGEVSEEALELTRVCEASLWAGLAAAQLGGRLTDISHAVESEVRRHTGPYGPYGIVDNYGGHGIGTAMHQAPHLLNWGRPGRGQRLVKGLALAVEPMVTLGPTADTRVLSDEWTVVTADRRYAAHWEHTVAITEEGPWVLTAFDGGVAKLAELGVTAGQPAEHASAT